MSFLFGKKVTPEENVRKWKRELKREERQIERNIRSIQLEENKTIKSIKDLAKKGQVANAKTLAKALVQSRKATERLYQSKAQLNSVGMQLQQQLSMMKLSGAMQKSAQVMAVMNNLVKLPQMHKVMMAMGREMEKAGLIEEMMDDVLDNDDELDEAADEELEKIVEEVVMGVRTAKVVKDELPQDDEKEDLGDLEARLGALKQ
eukprot:TRINITY_DN1415_c0_g1_i2.p1 TRINITY_DN1415_c0_g1~~TRINITY_DN1415_c0_g1_i2.p1  ORF type:complete len:204 (+),score=80.96 TRINITY_DN1415_c0_g1_i2:171-782(+)